MNVSRPGMIDDVEAASLRDYDAEVPGLVDADDFATRELGTDAGMA